MTKIARPQCVSCSGAGLASSLKVLLIAHIVTIHCTHHDEHQVGQFPQGAVLPEGLHKGGDVLFGIWAAHGQDGWLAWVAQETSNFLQGREVGVSQCDEWRSVSEHRQPLTRMAVQHGCAARAVQDN